MLYSVEGKGWQARKMECEIRMKVLSFDIIYRKKDYKSSRDGKRATRRDAGRLKSKTASEPIAVFAPKN